MNALSVRTPRFIHRAAIVALALLASVGASTAFTQAALAQSSPASQSSPSSAESAAVSSPTLDVFIAFDNSSQLSQAQFIGAQQAALDLVDALPPEARIGVISFGAFPQVTQFTAVDHESSRRAITNLSQEEGTSQLFSGIGLAAESFDSTSQASRAVVVVTDGRDGSSAQSIESGNRAALLNKVSVSIIDTSVPGDTKADRQLVVRRLAGSSPIAPAKDKVAIASLADQIEARSKPALPNEIALTAPESGISSSLFSSNIILMFGALLMGGAIFFGAMQLLGPREIKVNLTGIPLPSKKDKKAKDVKTPMAGLATKLSDIADKKLEKSGKSSGMQSWLERAAINLRSGEFLVLAVCVSLAFGAGAGVLLGKLWTPLGLAVGIFGTRFFVNRKANKRSNKFGDQLSDTLQLLSSSMRAGQGFMQALDAVSRESEAPTSEEFRRVVVETRLGRDLVDSMKALSERIRCIDMEWVIPAVEINRDIGGDLAEVLEQVGATIRDRADLRRQVKTLSAEGRLSAVVLIGMPFCLGGFINMSNPEYTHVLFSGFGVYLIGIAAVLMLIGSIWLFNICKIEF